MGDPCIREQAKVPEELDSIYSHVHSYCVVDCTRQIEGVKYTMMTNRWVNG